jgi:predicted Zn finger-like uncharacterized protein
MIVVCPSCAARFQYADARFQGALSKRFRCPKCSTVFEVVNPGFVEDPHAENPVEVRPVLPPTPLPPRPPAAPPQPPKPTETTSRKQRDAMMVSGLAGGGQLPSGMRFSLAFLTGPHASTARTLVAPVTIIGREEGDVIINDPETSRRHARIEIHSDGSAWLMDLGSTNGTFTGGKAIDRPTQLFDRQEFTCGKSTFMLLIRTVDSSMAMD